MVFSSLPFLFIFIPIFFILYYCFPAKHRNLILFLGSLVFYALGEPVYIVLILLSVLLNFQFGRLIDQDIPEETIKKGFSPEKRRTFWLVLSLLYNFGMLIIFKYTDFFIENWNAIAKGCNQILLPYFGLHHIQLPYGQLLKLPLPLGISFYTFQIVAYCIDVYRKKIPAEQSVINVGTYLCMFPQLIAGPIVIFSDVKSALQSRTCSMKSVDKGLKIFIYGLGLKVILANRIGLLWNELQTIGFSSISTTLAWLGALAYSMQLYFDFKGYSLMAVGLGNMLGFELPVNFKHPYISKSVTEFWRRWHITLGSWFREYVYIPLGGNRKGKMRTLFNLLVVWFLTGFWHGAGWNFIFWGLMIFVMQSIEKLFLLKWLEKSKFLSHIYLLVFVMVSWIVFAITNFHDLQIYLLRMFPVINQASSVMNPYDYIDKLLVYGPLLFTGILFCTVVPDKIFRKIQDNVLGSIVTLIIFWVSVYYLSLGMNNPFLYFRF